MSGLVKNKVDFFTTQLFSVNYKEQEKSLDTWDKCAIFASLFFGSLLCGVGALVGLGVSYYLRNRKIEVLEKSEQSFVHLNPDFSIKPTRPEEANTSPPEQNSNPELAALFEKIWGGPYDPSAAQKEREELGFTGLG